VSEREFPIWSLLGSLSTGERPVQSLKQHVYYAELQEDDFGFIMKKGTVRKRDILANGCMTLSSRNWGL
jgi:hypothetical protein